jgi:hypothetical protein
MTHDHDNPLELTIGCDACIERVKVDQIADQMIEWIDHWDCCDEDCSCEEPTASAWPARVLAVYRAMLTRGIHKSDIRIAVLDWADL